MRISRLFAMLLLAQGLAGCQDSRSWPFAPSPVAETPPSPPPVSEIPFTDIRSGVSTSDVHDAQEQVVRFNTAGEIIWAADGSRFPGFAIGRFGINDGSMAVQFGTKNGERRAYLVFSLDYHHYPPPAIIVDLEVVDGRLVIVDNQPPVPLPGG